MAPPWPRRASWWRAWPPCSRRPGAGLRRPGVRVTATGSWEDPSRYPTGTEVIRIDPAHPGDLGRSDNSYQALWVGIVLCALLTAVALCFWVTLERALLRTGSGTAEVPERSGLPSPP